MEDPKSHTKSTRYIPPHLRRELHNEQTGSTNNYADELELRTGGNNYAQATIQNHYWPDGEPCPNCSADKPCEDYYSCRRYGYNQSQTLHDSAANPGKISYVYLYSKQNPRWLRDRILFVKSRLDLLEPYIDTTKLDGEEFAKKSDSGDVADEGENRPDEQNSKLENNEKTDVAERDKCEGRETPATEAVAEKLDRPVFPVFEQHSSCSPLHMRHAGWFRVLRVDMLKPNSPELERMLRQKWEPEGSDENHHPHRRRRRRLKTRTRYEEQWVASISRPWAVIQLEEVYGENLRNYGLESLPPAEPARPLVSVTQMLTRLRMEDGNREMDQQNRD